MSKALNQVNMSRMLSAEKKRSSLCRSDVAKVKTIRNAAAPRLKSALCQWPHDETGSSFHVSGAILRVQAEITQEEAKKHLDEDCKWTSKF